MTELRLEGLEHVYPGGVQALDGVDLTIRGGERLALIGQNGSGKTTLVRHLNGLLRPGSGRVLHDGRDTAESTVARLAAVVGLVFQDPDRQIFSGSVRSEVEFGARNIGRRGDALREAVDRSLETVGLADQAGVNPYDLGTSRRKLLALASVLAMETPVLVLDEPTTGQDARGRELIARVIREVAGAGRTVIVVSHDMEFVAEHFERIVVLGGGRVLLDGPPAAVFGPDAWTALESTHLEPTLAARVGDRLGLGPTPTDEALLEVLAAGASSWPGRSGTSGSDAS